MLGTLISPAVGLKIVKSAIEKTIKKDIEDFDMIYKAEKNVIDIRLYNYVDDNGVLHEKIVKKYADGEKLCSIISSMLKSKINNGDVIDMAIINYKTLTCSLCITKDNEKIIKKLKL